MNNLTSLFSFIFKKKTLVLLMCINLIGLLFSLYNRFIYVDDAWFGEQAYWFSKLGYVKVASIIDYFSWENRLFVYHKLSIIIGAFLIKLFGWSVTPLRAFTLLVYALFFIVFFRYFKTQQKQYEPGTFIIAAFFIFFNPMTLLYSFTYRPEILVTTLGFSSFYLLDASLRDKMKKWQILFSGVLSGLAFLVHINGIVFILAGGVLLLSYKNYRMTVIFFLFSGLTTLLYFYDLWQPGHFQQFLFQIRNWPDSVASNYLATGPLDYVYRFLLKLLSEHQRFFWSPKVWGISSLFFFSLIINFKTLVHKYKSLMIYLLTIVISLNIFGSYIAEIYWIYYLPFMAIVIAVTIIKLKEQSSTLVKIVVLLILMLQAVSVGMMYNFIFSKNGIHVEQHHRLMAQIDEPDALVLVPYRFVFNELEDRNLATFKGFEYHQVEIGKKLSEEEFLQRAKTLNIKYIIVSPEFIDGRSTLFPWMIKNTMDELPLYKPIYQDAGYIILALRE